MKGCLPKRRPLFFATFILPAFFLLMLAFSALPQGAQAQTVLQDRITQPIESASSVPLMGSVHPLARIGFDTGLVDNAKVLQGMTINFKRSAAQEASLQALLAAQQDPSSPSYHQWLTPAQFGQQFGMSAADLAQVSAWLQQEGFTVTFAARSGNAISFSGSVASVERAFQTQIHNYTVNGETHFANSTQISIPAALGGLVNSVRGLDNFTLKPRLLKSKFTSPGDLAVIYRLYSTGDTGKGVTLAVIGQTDIVASDITEFRASAGLPVNNPTVFTVPGTTPLTATAGANTGDLTETDLDLEYLGGVAAGASVVLVNSNDVTTSLQYTIQNPINGITIPIISQSYGACEAAYPTAAWTAEEAVLAQAKAQGQTVILAAGDDGAADCDEGAKTRSTSSSVTVTVAASGTKATTTSVTASPASFPLGSSVTLTATVSGATAGTLTGQMTFTTGGVNIGTVKQVSPGSGNTANATLTVNATSPLGFAPGTDTITATYGGDAYNANSAGTTTVTVSNPSITVSATDVTISSPSPGHSGTSTITLTSTGGYAGTAVVSASSASLAADYEFGASSAQTASILLSAGGTGTTTMTIETIAAGGDVRTGPAGKLAPRRIAAAGGTAAGCLLLLLIPGIRKKRWPAALVMLVLLSAGAGLGCGGGTGGAAPPGTYTVTVTATDSSNANITGSTTLTVTIQ